MRVFYEWADPYAARFLCCADGPGSGGDGPNDNSSTGGGGGGIDVGNGDFGGMNAAEASSLDAANNAGDPMAGATMSTTIGDVATVAGVGMAIGLAGATLGATAVATGLSGAINNSAVDTAAKDLAKDAATAYGVTGTFEVNNPGSFGFFDTTVADAAPTAADLGAGGVFGQFAPDAPPVGGAVLLYPDNPSGAGNVYAYQPPAPENIVNATNDTGGGG